MTTQLDEERSLDIAQQIKSKDNKPFDNACKAALAIENARYVQGFLVVAGQPNKILEHAWIVLDDSIIDPSWVHLHRQVADLHYFAAQSLTVKQLKATLEESKEDYPEDDPLPIYGAMPYEYYGEVMLGGKDYLKAYQAAEAQYKALNQRSAENN
ncbi:hypothetical protein IFO70_22370 [Phormidium tenue FACHB-886]|nr:hypothetical protein [Phormidium tenue FACHB-886]